MMKELSMEQPYQTPKSELDEITLGAPITVGGTLSQIVLIGFALIILIDVASVAAGIHQVILLDDLINGVAVSDDTIAANDQWYSISGIAQSLAYLATAIGFFFWIYRAYKNLQAMNIPGLKYSPSWAVGYFFIPILNLFRPYQVVKEIWQQCASAADSKLYGTELVEVSAKIGWWWMFFVVHWMLSRASSRMMLRAESGEEYVSATYFALVTDIVNIMGAIAAIVMIKAVDQRQEKKLIEVLSKG